MDNYTFFGDLLGVAGYYRLSPGRAYGRLNDFYNCTFACFRDYCHGNDVHVSMISDSLLIWGSDTRSILARLQRLYLRLGHTGLLLRGALVHGRLEPDPRLTLDNFEKMLPRNDTLARAVGLEKSYKGARLLIENSIAERLLSSTSDWLTPEGYLQRPMPSVPVHALDRRICPTPDHGAYEMLYFWVLGREAGECVDLQARREQLVQMRVMVSDEIAQHYIETLRLIDRCEARRQFTEIQICNSTLDPTGRG